MKMCKEMKQESTASLNVIDQARVLIIISTFN